MADVSEFWKGLRTALLADSTLVALLGTQAAGIDDAVFFGFPDVAVVFPILTITDRQMNPVGDNSFTGVWRPTVTFQAYSDSPFTNDAIFSRLEDVFAIPANLPAGITTTHYQITELHFENAIDLGPLKVVDTNELIRGTAVPARMRVTKLTASLTTTAAATTTAAP